MVPLVTHFAQSSDLHTPRTRYVLLIGHFGGHNTGDEAMLAGALTGLSEQERASLRVVVKVEAEAEVQATHGIKAVPASLRAVVPMLWKADGLVLVGGTHFHDDYRLTRYIRHVRYMTRIVIGGILMRVRRRRVLWLGVGIGPITRPLTRLITRVGLLACNEVTVRDEASANAIAEITRTARVTLGFDLAALAAHLPSLQKKGCNAEETPILGVSVTSLRDRQQGNPSTAAVIWESFIEGLVHAIVTRPHLRVRVFVIRGGDREDDNALSRWLVERLSEHSHNIELVPYHHDPMVTIEEISRCTHFIATRYHAAVLAYLCHCRLLLLSYHRKVADFGHTIGLGSAAIFELSRPEDLENLFDELVRFLGAAPAFQATLELPEAISRANLARAPLLSLIRSRS